MSNLSQAELASLMSGGTDQAQLIGGLLGERAGNPLVQMLLSQMLGRSDSTDTGAEDDAFDEIEDGEFEELPDPRLTARRRRLKARLTEWREELFALRRHNDELAGALGACCRCWGYDDECPDCGGTGEPGWQEPEPGGFRRIVEPAIRRLQTGARSVARSANQNHPLEEERP